MTERGRPVARRSALDLNRARERVAQLLREGRVRAPRGRAPAGPSVEVRRPKSSDPDGRSMAYLLAERAGRS